MEEEHHGNDSLIYKSICEQNKNLLDYHEEF